MLSTLEIQALNSIVKKMDNTDFEFHNKKNIDKLKVELTQRLITKRQNGKN